MINYESHETLSHTLTPEGAQISLQGSHEARVWAALSAKGAGSTVTPAELKKIIGDEAAKVGQGRAFKNGWIAKDGGGLVKAVRQQRPASPAARLTNTSRGYQGIIDRGHDPKRTP